MRRSPVGWIRDEVGIRVCSASGGDITARLASLARRPSRR
jgi:hypothetical protein